MTEGIEKAIEIERSKEDDLYFIDIVANDIDYLPQLKILHDETSAPILIASSNFDEDEREKALNIGADHYGEYCVLPEKNIRSVIAAINSIERRAKKNKSSSKVIVCHGVMLVPAYRNNVFVGNKNIRLTRQEFDLLYYLMLHQGKVMTYKQIFTRVWGSEYEDTARDVLRNAVKRLRDKLRPHSNGTEHIQTVIDVGYSFPVHPIK